MNKYFIQTTKTARFFTIGEIDNKVKKVWILLHGYAQNADSFLSNLSELQKENILLVAPEGLSNFYWKDFSSNPVSSWMTRLERENDIQDINSYLNKLLNQVVAEIGNDTIEINVLGFSQGAPVLMRWIQTCQHKINLICLLAGKPAHDINWSKEQNYFRNKTIHFLYGTEDRIVHQSDINTFKELFQKESVNFIVHPFEGKHEVNRETVAILEKLYN